MQPELKLSFVDRLRMLRETRLGAFVPVLLALAAIWVYFGLALPVWDHWSDPSSEGIRFIFLSPRNIYNLFMQSAVAGRSGMPYLAHWLSGRWATGSIFRGQALRTSSCSQVPSCCWRWRSMQCRARTTAAADRRSPRDG